MAVKSLNRSGLVTFQKYSSMLAGNDPYFPGAYDLLESVILSGNQSSVTFSSLGAYAADYKHLQIRYSARGTNSYTTSFMVNVQLNGVGTQTYAYHYMYNGSAPSIGSTGNASYVTSMQAGYYAGSGVTANTFGAGIIDFLDPFSPNKNTTIRGISAQPANSVGIQSAFWNNTAAVTSIRVAEASGGAFITGSRFSIYGIKG